jgi:hypothetical protein
MNLALAVKFGTDESLFLTNLCFWIEKNKANKVNYHDGHYWVYNTMEAWAELFPYFSKYQIRHLIDKMRSRDILLVGVYNRVQYDRTQWYSVSDEVMDLYTGRFQKEGREEGGERKGAEERREAPETPEGEAGREAAEEGSVSCPPGPMDVGKVPPPCAPEGRWMWENSQMEVRNFPNGSAKNHTTIPYNKPINKPAAAAQEKPKGQMPLPVENCEKAAAGFFDIEKLKAALTGISGELVFDGSFYPKARDYLNARGFDVGYLSRLYGECRKREPGNPRGLYFSLFAREDMASLYRHGEKERREAKAPAGQTICPACGTAYQAGLECCPECEPDKKDWGNPDKIARQERFRRLSREAKDGYAKERWEILSRALKSESPFEQAREEWIRPDKKYRLPG